MAIILDLGGCPEKRMGVVVCYLCNTKFELNEVDSHCFSGNPPNYTPRCRKCAPQDFQPPNDGWPTSVQTIDQFVEECANYESPPKDQVEYKVELPKKYKIPADAVPVYVGGKKVGYSVPATPVSNGQTVEIVGPVKITED